MTMRRLVVGLAAALLFVGQPLPADAVAISFTPAYSGVSPPTCGPASTTVNEGSSSNPLTLSLGGGAATSVNVTSGPSNGSTSITGTTIFYTPTGGFSGSDSLTYTATNAGGTCAGATASITVTPVIGTPVELGKSASANMGAGNTLATTTTNTAPAGQLIVWFGGSSSNQGGTNEAALTSGADTVSNTYHAMIGGGGALAAHANGLYVLNPTALPSGDTFTGAYSLPNNANAVQIGYSVGGILTSGAADAFSVGTSTGTSVSITESFAASNPYRIVWAMLYVAGGASDTFTEASGWTTAPGSPVVTGASPNDAMHIAYKVVNTTTAQTYNPTLGTSRLWGGGTQSFDGQ